MEETNFKEIRIASDNTLQDVVVKELKDYLNLPDEKTIRNIMQNRFMINEDATDIDVYFLPLMLFIHRYLKSKYSIDTDIDDDGLTIYLFK